MRILATGDHLTSAGLNHSFAQEQRSCSCAVPLQGWEEITSLRISVCLPGYPEAWSGVADAPGSLTQLCLLPGQLRGVGSTAGAALAVSPLGGPLLLPAPRQGFQGYLIRTEFARHASLSNRPSLISLLLYHWFHLDHKHPSINK